MGTTVSVHITSNLSYPHDYDPTTRNDIPTAIIHVMNRIAKAVGWGFLIYAVMYLVWSGLVIYGLSLGYVSLIIRLLVLFVITTIAARAMRLSNWRDVLPFSIGWALVAATLDALYLVPFSGWALYSSLSVWIGYALVAVLPIFGLSMRRLPFVSQRTD